jgi:hypothetical protein
MSARLVKNLNFVFFNIDIKTPISIHNPEVKTSIHVFDHTIKPILLYGCEIWGYFNPFTSRFRNGNIPIDQIFSKLHCEKLQFILSKVEGARVVKPYS